MRFLKGKKTREKWANVTPPQILTILSAKPLEGVKVIREWRAEDWSRVLAFMAEEEVVLRKVDRVVGKTSPRLYRVLQTKRVLDKAEIVQRLASVGRKIRFGRDVMGSEYYEETARDYKDASEDLDQYLNHMILIVWKNRIVLATCENIAEDDE